MPFGNGVRDVCRFWRIVLLVLVLVLVPEIRPALFTGVSRITVPWRPVCLISLCSLPLPLLLTSRSPAPAMPPVRPLLASGSVRLRRLWRPVDPRDVLAEQLFDGLDCLEI